MRRLVALAVLGLAAACDAPEAYVEVASVERSGTACLPEGYDRDRLEALAADEFRIEDATERSQFALGIAACLSDPDPDLRDGIAYESLASMMRRNEIDHDTLRSLRDQLYPKVYEEDRSGLAAPFAALVLAEIARTDRIESWMENEERDDMLTRACLYLSGVSDYRGYIDGEGWRHGVAHGADWLLQLALNPSFAAGQRIRMLMAVSEQISPDGHAYTFGEPERLARVAVAVAYRDAFSDEVWGSLLFNWTQPDGPDGWDNTFQSEAGMIHRHNVRAFLSAMYIALDSEAFDGAQQLRTLVGARLSEIP